MAKLITVRLAGQEPLDLKVGAFVIHRMEMEAGIPIGALWVPAANKGRYGVSTWVYTLWAGLLWKRPKLTLEEASELIDRHLENGGDISTLVEMVNEASGYLMRSRREAEAGEEADPPPPPSPPSRPTDGASTATGSVPPASSPASSSASPTRPSSPSIPTSSRTSSRDAGAGSVAPGGR